LTGIKLKWLVLMQLLPALGDYFRAGVTQ